MMLCFAFFGVARAQSELTVHDGTATNGYVPVYGFYADAYLKCEMVYPAAELAEMTGGTISSLTFYASQANVDWGTEFQVFVAEVDETTISDFAGPGTVVYEGALTISDNQMVVEFGSPYTYNGGNLLVGVYQTTTGSYLSSSWYGETVDGASVQGYSYSGLDAITATSRNFLPKTTFTYIPAGGSVCEKPATFEVTDITGYAATCTWESEVGNYTFEWKKASETDWTVVSGLTATTYQLDNLEPFTVYNTRVKAVCGTDSESGYKTANFTTLDVCPDGLVCIGEGTATNSYLPTYFFYNYSLTEQIYTADEIGTAGAIESVDIYSVGTGTRTLEIYMVSTEKRAFEGDDWIPATASDLVFSGEVTFAANSWNTFEFDNPFIYNGTSNVALIVRDMTGSYFSGIQFFVFEAESQALYAYRDASEYDLAAPGVTGTVLSVKNRVRFAIGEPPACPKPTGLAVNYEGGTSATFTWTENGTATSWDLQYSTDAEFNEYTSAQVDGTPSYELTGLELATTYYVRVNAFCEAPSEYSTTISFTTDACMPENKCALTFVVTDSYGDGWNGASIDIYDYTGETLGDLLASITNQNLDGLTSNTEETQTLTYNFCDGQELAFIWTSGSYDSEVSYTVTDLNGDVVVEGSGEGFDGFAYTMDCSVTDCRRPTDFAASEIANHSVVLSWTENGPATEWVIAYISENDEEISYITTSENPYTLTGLDPETMYAAQVTPVCEVEKPSEVIYWTTDVACPKPFDMNVTPYPFTANVEWSGYAEAYEIEWAEMPASKDPYNEDGWYYYDNGTYAGSVGLGGGEFHWGIMLPAGSFEGTTIDVVKAYDINAMVGTLAIYNDGETAPDNQLSIQNIEFTGAGEWVEFNVGGVTVNPSKNVWIVFDAVDGAAYPIGTSSDDNGDANGRWVEINGTWYDMANVGVTGRANMLRAHFVSFNYDDLNWTTVSGVTSPYLIEGLQAETTYIVRVKALCGGEDGESAWTTMTFTTPSACDMPIDLVAEDITYNSATLNWTGYQESFNVKYRQVPHGEVYASANFDDSSMGEWTTIDADGDSLTWVLATASAGVYHNEGVDLTGQGHNSSNDFIVSGSYTNAGGAALTPDNYLVSPQITLGGSITFWAQAQDANYSAEHFGVAVSTTVNDDAAAFTTIAEWTMTAKGGDRGNVSKLVVGGGAKMEPVATTRSGENLRAGTWYQYTVDLSAYSGQGYVAIRHFDCTDQFILNVDDIVIEGAAPTIEWTTVTVTEPTLALTGLAPETEYEWQVQGINASCGELEWVAGPNFTTPKCIQTIALAQGWNWVSTYVEITLDDLKAALLATYPDAAINQLVIKGNGVGQTAWNPNAHRWIGQLTTMNLSQMYMVKAPEAGEITLEGMPIDVTTLELTINPGVNWIAFPLSQGMSLAEAFAGFSTNQDVVKGNGLGQATWNNNAHRWVGQLQNLVPGQGYIYNSKATESKPFYYPAAAK